eukprot:284443_1
MKLNQVKQPSVIMCTSEPFYFDGINNVESYMKLNTNSSVYQPHYYQFKDTQKEIIIYSNNNGIFQYEIANNTYSKICDLHKKASPSKLILASRLIIHNLLNQKTGTLYRLHDDNSIILYNIPKEKWLGYVECNVPFYESLAIYVSYPHNYIYLICLKYGTQFTGYKFKLKKKKFIEIHQPKDIPIKPYQYKNTSLFYVQSLQTLMLITCADCDMMGVLHPVIYQLNCNDKWTKFMDVTIDRSSYGIKAVPKLWQPWFGYVVAVFGYVLMLFFPHCLCCIDLLNKKSWYAMDRFLTTSIYIVKTNNNYIHLFGANGGSYYSPSNYYHYKVNVLDVLPGELKTQWMKKLHLFVNKYIHIEEKINNCVVPDSLKQIIMAYASSILTKILC